MATIIVIILLLLAIGILVRIHIFIVSRTLRRSLNSETAANNNAIDRGSLGSTSMSRDDIEKLPCFDFKAKEEQKGTSPPPNCAVCLENFCSGEKCRLLPTCNHSFHAECVDLWLLRASFCPICRADADTATTSLCGGDSNRFIMSGDRVREEEPSDEVEVVVVVVDEAQQELGDNNIVNSGFSKSSQEMESAASVSNDRSGEY